MPVLNTAPALYAGSLRASRAVLNGVQVWGWDPGMLFEAGESGAWYDPSDPSTLFQDTGGTIPVTAIGQPVALILDKSGNGNHALQAAPSTRPIWRGDHLEFDGVNDSLGTAPMNFRGASAATVAMATYRTNTAAHEILGLGANPAALNGAFSIEPSYSSGYFSAYLRGAAAARKYETGNPINQKSYVTIGLNLPAPRDLAITLRINGVLSNAATAGAAPDGTAFGTYPLYIGRRGGTAGTVFGGRIYCIVVRGTTSSPQQVADLEAYFRFRMKL